MARRLLAVALVAIALLSPTLGAREFSIAEGKLLLVDTGARRIVVRTGQGALQCAFDANTRVTGVADRIDALTAMSLVTVHYASDERQAVATLIEVHPGF